MGKKGKSRSRPVKLKTESAAMAAAGEKLRFDKAVFGPEAPMSKGKKLVREKQYEKTSYGRKAPAAKKAKAAAFAELSVFSFSPGCPLLSAIFLSIGSPPPFLFFLRRGDVRRAGGHDLKELRILREAVHEGQDHVPVKKQPFPGAGMRHVGELVR